MWGYVIGGATVFGLIVGLFSMYNGRVTRREIANVITEEGRRLSEQHLTMIEVLKSFKGSRSEKRKFSR